MKSTKVKEILKVFPELTKTEDFHPGSNECGIHFIWDDEELKYYLILAPFFLNDAYLERVPLSNGLPVHPYTPADIYLLINTPVYDGHGFGIWTHRYKQENIYWYNLNPNQSEDHFDRVRKIARISAGYFTKLQKEFEAFKTILLLYGIEINVDKEREQ